MTKHEEEVQIKYTSSTFHSKSMDKYILDSQTLNLYNDEIYGQILQLH